MVEGTGVLLRVSRKIQRNQSLEHVLNGSALGESIKRLGKVQICLPPNSASTFESQNELGNKETPREVKDLWMQPEHLPSKIFCVFSERTTHRYIWGRGVCAKKETLVRVAEPEGFPIPGEIRDMIWCAHLAITNGPKMEKHLTPSFLSTTGKLPVVSGKR